MDFNFTRFISFDNIDVDGIDLYEDAYGLNAEFIDVKELLSRLHDEPHKSVRLVWKEKMLN
ncbi:MAG TPA: hypothetical protein VHO46_05555 [Bacteroidales bacterium]|nr:hypothetical protein [Bacteroidales bacterium]